jgi:tetratricopeptide (TPR) repeat protein
MKKSLLLAGALLVAVASFGQKKEIKKAQKAFTKGDIDVAQMWLDTAATKLIEADLETKIDYYIAKGKVALAQAGKSGFEQMKEAAAAFMKAQELDTNNEFEELIENGATKIRVALVNSAVKDQNAKNFALASEKLQLSYLVKKDTSDLYFAAANAQNAKDFDKALDYYTQLLDMGYTGIKKEYTALRIEDNKTVTFASEQDRNTELLSGKYTKPGERMSESVKGNILRRVVLMYTSKGEYDKAIGLMREAREENPEDISLVKAEASMVYEMGNIARYDELMEQVLAYDPTDPEPYFNIGAVAASSGNPNKAREFYKKAIELKPDFVSALVNLGALILRDEMKIMKEMNSLGMSRADSKKYNALEIKRDGLYNEALPYLEVAYNYRSDNAQLVAKLKEIYGLLGMDAKESEMKSKLSELEN